MCNIEKSRNMITLITAVVGESECIPILCFMNDQQEFYPIPRIFEEAEISSTAATFFKF